MHNFLENLFDLRIFVFLKIARIGFIVNMTKLSLSLLKVRSDRVCSRFHIRVIISHIFVSY